MRLYYYFYCDQPGMSTAQARAMAARLIGLIASRGDDLRAQLLAAGALDGLMTALGAMDAVASAGGPLPVPHRPPCRPHNLICAVKA